MSTYFKYQYRGAGAALNHCDGVQINYFMYLRANLYACLIKLFYFRQISKRNEKFFEK